MCHILHDVIVLKGTNGQDNMRVGRQPKGSSTVVEGKEGGNDSTNRADLLGPGRLGVVTKLVCGHEQEMNIQDDKHGDCGDCGSRGADREDDGEEGPDKEKDTSGVLEGLGGGVSVGLLYHCAGHEHVTVGGPVGAERREGCGFEGVADLHGPHAGQDLNDTTVPETKAHEYGSSATGGNTGTEIVDVCDESGDSEGKETERTGVAVGGLDDADSRWLLMRLGDVGVVGREVSQFCAELIGHCSEEATVVLLLLRVKVSEA